MLKEFRVKGFKNFAKELVMDFTARDYDFNTDAVKNGIVKDCMVYGPNGCGKSNLGLALFDIVLNLTDKEKQFAKYRNYENLDVNISSIDFGYTFVFEGINVEYTYSKANVNEIIREKLVIDDKIVILWDKTKKNSLKLELDGASKLNLDLFDGVISFTKYVYRSVSLDMHKTEARLFKAMFDFVERMLYFRSLRFNEYMGLMNGGENINKAIIKEGKLKDFQKFLGDYGVQYNLVPGPNNDYIMCQFKKAVVTFDDVMSTGTDALRLIYYWLLKLDCASFVFIDEFDAFYHWRVAVDIVGKLKVLSDTQCVLTTHNTDNMDNDIFRPDCYYVLNGGQVKSLPNLTNKELREAHNLQKMYVAGAFDK